MRLPSRRLSWAVAALAVVALALHSVWAVTDLMAFYLERDLRRANRTIALQGGQDAD